MLTNTFCHLPGIGLTTERRLWQQGITTWSELLDAETRQLELFRRPRGLASALEDSFQALERQDCDYFAERLPASEVYRMVRTFPERTLFLDIETTGLSHYYDEITLVGWGMNGTFSYVVPWDDPAEFLARMEEAAAIVTFNGSLFDLRFVRRDWPQARMPSAHVDLRFLARRADLSGGQKGLEVDLGIRRPDGLDVLSGADAVLLWHDFSRGIVGAWETLLMYNLADVQGLREVLVELTDRLLSRLNPPPSLDRGSHPPRPTPRWSGSPPEEVFRGRTGPRTVLSDLPAVESLRTVGIDLTGSEARATGWALISRANVETALIHTDQELVERTVAADPHIVSIDSPLSLPEGRLTPFDDDPTREAHGIMRQCERELKRRGVNVYPSLLPSMQRLTERGMRLAAAFRARGLPVIESYPGAAQDIMGIPRKRASEDHLLEGLEAFGLHVPDRRYNHDELDAITSAVVALFFWAGRYEALGSAVEEHLIIPSLASMAACMGQAVVGLSGPIASGKTTAGGLLSRRGFRYARFSAVLEEMLVSAGSEVCRESLQTLGRRIFEEGRQRELEWRLLAPLEGVKRIVVDGLRHPHDHAFLVEQFGPRYIHVAIEAPRELRRRRYLEEGHSAADFDIATGHAAEQNVRVVNGLAHVTVENQGSVSDLAAAVAALTL